VNPKKYSTILATTLVILVTTKKNSRAA